MMCGKIMKKLGLLSVLFLSTVNIIVSTLETSYDYEPCLPTTEYFECDDGECISKEYHCDGEKDCFDESDERNCSSGIRCRSRMFQCDDGKCILDENLCDLHDDCKDGSDETNCTNRVCGEDEFRCSSGQCTRKGAFCEGSPDCHDGSDENNCTHCLQDDDFRTFKCRNVNRCISARALCDFQVDCPDGSDEDEISCKRDKCEAYEFLCDNGRCIFKAHRCDGNNDCYDNSDETHCTKCPLTTFQCDTDQMCISASNVCDTQPDCPDGSDEDTLMCLTRKCTEYGRTLRCQSGQCVGSGHKNSSVCDGWKDCRDGSDEARCKSKSNIICESKHTFKCATKEDECIPKVVLCNSKSDCSDGSDENQLNCPNGVKPPLWATFWRWSHGHESHNRNVSLKYSEKDIAIYAEEAIVTSVTWPEPLLSKAWKYSQDTYSHLKDSSSKLLYVVSVVYGKNTENYCYKYSSIERRSGFRNLIDCQIRERNAWTLENAANFELVFSNLGTIIKNGAESEHKNNAQSRCGDSLSDIIFYDIYATLKGQTPNVIKWREGKMFKIHGKINCFRDWFFPIYNKFGGAATFNKFFILMKLHWAKKKGDCADRVAGSKEPNLGELVHFWNTAAGADLTILANDTFGWTEMNENQLARAQIDFPSLFYEETSGNRNGNGAHIFAGIVVLWIILLFVAVWIKLNKPYITQKYQQLTRRYW